MTTITDPTAPGFVHGTESGYRHGCDCSTCGDAAYRAGKQRRVRLSRGIRRRTDEATQARVRAHVEQLRDMHPGHTIRSISTSAGLPETLLEQFMNGKTKDIFVESASALLAVTPDSIVKHFYPIEDARRLIGQLQALGYSIRWQEKRTGIDMHGVFASPYPTVRAYVYEALRALLASTGESPADPERDGLTKQGITQAKAAARRNGFYPPACYDEDGTLNPRAIPDHPWAIADDKAHRKIELLRTFVTNDGRMSRSEVAAACGQDVKNVDRLVERYGLQLDQPRRPKRIAWLAAQLDRYDTDSVDPVRFCIDIGLTGADQFSSKHPAVAQWIAEHPEWERPTDITKMRLREAATEQVAA